MMDGQYTEVVSESVARGNRNREGALTHEKLSTGDTVMFGRDRLEALSAINEHSRIVNQPRQVSQPRNDSVDNLGPGVRRRQLPADYHRSPYSAGGLAAAGIAHGPPSTYFGDKPVDRRLSYSDVYVPESARPRAPFPTSTTYAPRPVLERYPAGNYADQQFPVSEGSRGVYDPLFEARSTYDLPPQRLATPEELLFARGVADTHQTVGTDSPRLSRAEQPGRRQGRRSDRYIDHSDDDESPRERVPILKPKEFDGKGSWMEFLRRFNMVALSNNWSYTTKGDQLKNSLIGEAGSIVHRNPASVYWTYDEVVAQVGAVYGPSKDHQFMIVDKLERRRRKRGEALHTLRDDICELVEMAYPDASPARREAICVERFIRGLDHPKIVHKLLELSPRTLDEAFRAAKLEEATWHAACSITQSGKSDATQRAIQVDPMSVGDVPQEVSEPEEGLLLAEVRKLGAMVSDLKVKVDGQKDQKKSYPRDRNNNRSGDGESTTDGRREGGDGEPGGDRQRKQWRHPFRGSRRRGPIVCRRCQEQGHMARDCMAPAPVPKEDRPSN